MQQPDEQKLISDAMVSGLLPVLTDKYLYRMNDRTDLDALENVAQQIEYRKHDMTVQGIAPEYRKYLDDLFIVTPYQYGLVDPSSFFTADERMKTRVRGSVYWDLWKGADSNFVNAILRFDDDILSSLIQQLSQNQMVNYYIFSPDQIRSMLETLFVYANVKTAAIFNPLWLYGIMDYLLPKLGYDIKDQLNVLDVPVGWGDRMIGYSLQNRKRQIRLYHGVDPNSNLISAYRTLLLYTELNGLVFSEPFETLNLRENYYDIIGGSPPFFNFERYTNNLTQSYNRFNQMSDWVENFVIPSAQKMYRSLKPGGFIYIHAIDMGEADVLSSFIRALIAAGADYMGLILLSDEYSTVKYQVIAIAGKPAGPR